MAGDLHGAGDAAGWDSPQHRRSGSQTLVGVVLCGGASRRMGRDKALIGDPPWAHRVAAALRAGGCSPVELQGGSVDLATPDWAQVSDMEPGGGPAPAVVQAATRHRGAAMLVAACDLPDLGAASVLHLIECLDAAGGPRMGRAAAFSVDGRPNWSLVAMDAGLVARVAAMAPGSVSGRPLRSLLESTVQLLEAPLAFEVTDIDEPPEEPPIRGDDPRWA